MESFRYIDFLLRILIKWQAVVPLHI